ncbi:MAG TPA: phospholipase D-like domain-containing protein [Patescibacteria group bacterium]|nr:phospholipase D-like domain-containing protein [Patescibacteria group bacterium]
MAALPKSIDSSSGYTFYTTTEYWAELQRRIDQTTAGGRIAMMVMDFNPTEPLMQAVFQKLFAAADRGVNVWVSVDAHTFMFNPETRSISSFLAHNDLQKLPKPLAAKLRLLRELGNKPTGHTAIINKPKHSFSNPVAGRSHIKMSVVDDYIFVGGCNLQHTAWLDLMVGWQSKKIAGTLLAFVSDVIGNESTRTVMHGLDRCIPLDELTNLYIDAGKPGQSIILTQALALIDAAQESITMTCQYFPNAITAQHLAAAHKRGVRVEIIYSHPAMHGLVGGLGQHVSMLLERTRVPAKLFHMRLPASGPALHAKLIATEQGAIVGSHNYVRAGVRLGTAEIAVVQHTPGFSQNALAALRRELTY